MTRRRHSTTHVLAARFLSPVQAALDEENTRAALAALANMPDPRPQEHAMTRPTPGPQQQPSQLRVDVDALRTTVATLTGQVANLTDTVLRMEKEMAALRTTVSEDETNERIVSFLDGLGGVKLSGISIAENLSIDPKTIHSRLQRLSSAGRITVHRERNRNALFSVPLR